MTEQREKLNLATSLDKRVKKMENGERSRIANWEIKKSGVWEENMQ